jgi:hypothetical protein
MKTLVMWDWYDFGIVLKINKLTTPSEYHLALDIQILWLNIWVQFWTKKYHYENRCRKIK